MNYMRLQEQNAGDLYKMITDETAAREKLGKALQARNPKPCPNHCFADEPSRQGLLVTSLQHSTLFVPHIHPCTVGNVDL